MNKAIALLVGLKKVDSNAAEYSAMGERREGISGSELDANNMERLLLNHGGFIIHKLLTQQATGKSMLDNIDLAASSLNNGDLFFFFFSGHGDQIKDENGDEADHLDEALAAYDRRIIDDELPPIWAKFRPGVRILMISDTCNSGTIFRGQVPPRADGFALEAPLQIKASLIHIAATRDHSDTLGNANGSVFTNALLEAWNNGSFQGDYNQFLGQVKKIISDPILSQAGPNVAAFVGERPFTV
jgi:hypothetical protein